MRLGERWKKFARAAGLAGALAGASMEAPAHAKETLTDGKATATETVRHEGLKDEEIWHAFEELKASLEEATRSGDDAAADKLTAQLDAFRKDNMEALQRVATARKAAESAPKEEVTLGTEPADPGTAEEIELAAVRERVEREFAGHVEQKGLQNPLEKK